MTKRISDESGQDAGYHNIGRFFLALIPWALGIGAAVWLGVWIGVHDFRHELSAEERAAIYTGAAERPKAKVVIEVIPTGCIHITRADLDGSMLMIYARNDCSANFESDYLEYHWSALSPNGTVIKQGYTNQCPVPSRIKDTAECVFKEGQWNAIPDDDRIAKIRVWTTG